MPNSAEILKQTFANRVGLPFQQILPESVIARVLVEETVSYRDRLFNPFVTLWAFLSPVFDSDKRCRKAVSRVISWLASAGRPVST
ncbi:hypothetical protein [Phormidesmis sp. 146-33]